MKTLTDRIAQYMYLVQRAGHETKYHIVYVSQELYDRDMDIDYVKKDESVPDDGVKRFLVGSFTFEVYSSPALTEDEIVVVPKPIT